LLSSAGDQGNTGNLNTTGGEGSGTSSSSSRPVLRGPNIHVYPIPVEGIPVEGQGENPTVFTVGIPNQPLDNHNTWNTSDGRVDFCEVSGGNHKWNPGNVWNSDKYNGFCYNCKEEIKLKYQGCSDCFRHICNSCDTAFNRHASLTFSESVRNSLCSNPKP
jgi:hypothetical protein